MPELNNRDQIIAKVKESDSILITVSDNPSVDELASALALTLAINKSGKHATAVASGKMPDALEFLNPNKTFETSVDSLRDFIIALSKDKADHLRYKIVGDHVKIFITPYKYNITEKDLEFEQGDFNVDFILALGVHDKDHLDGALAAHGRIFHDASVGVLTVGENPSSLAELNWHSENASSLSEMVLEIIESGSIDKKSLTKPVATAILTGIVAETERFSNAKTSAKVMNIASKLILAGADQQLVISKNIESETKNANFEIQNEQIETLEQKTEATPKRDHSVLTIEREKASDEDELEASLEALSKPTENAFSELEKDPELAKIESLAVDFPAVENPKIEKIEEVPAEITEQIQPEFSYEELPPMPAQPVAEPAPQVEIQPEAQPEIQPEFETPQNFENVQPEVPAPISNFEQPNAFISEQPVETQIFEPAPQVEIQPEAQPEIQPEFETPQNFENVQPEVPAPTFGAREYISNNTGDDYYHPEENREYISGIVQDSQILSHENSGNFNPENVAVMPETQPYSHAKTIEPLTMGNSNFENQPANNFGGFPPPAPNFDAMMPPALPPIPDFGQMPPMGEIPTPDFGLPPVQEPINEADFNFQNQPEPAPAQGVQASTNNIMTDQIYPQDPSQFRIPGM